MNREHYAWREFSAKIASNILQSVIKLKNLKFMYIIDLTSDNKTFWEYFIEYKSSFDNLEYVYDWICQ